MSKLINLSSSAIFLKDYALFGYNIFILCQKVNRRHCVKSVRIQSFSGPNTGKYGPEKLRI